MKKMKRLLALTLALMMIVAIFAIPAAAVEARDVSFPTTVSCNTCGKTAKLTDVTIGVWTNRGTQPCQHGHSGVDILQARGVTAYYSCGTHRTYRNAEDHRVFCTAS